MKQTKLLSLLTLLLATFSCSFESQTKGGAKIYDLQELISTTETITLEEMGAKVSEIKVQPAGNMPFAQIYGFAEYNNFYYLQFWTPMYIAKYDKQGNYINLITRRGKAKNEMQDLGNFYVRGDGNLEIEGTDNKAIFSPEGEFIKSTDAPYLTTYTKYSGGSANLPTTRHIDKNGNIFSSFVCWIGVEPQEFAVQNPAGDTIYVRENRRPFTLAPGAGVTFSATKHPIMDFFGETIYREAHSDTVFTFNYDKLDLEPRYIFKNNNAPTIEDFANKKIFDRNTLIMEMIETKNYICLKVKMKNEVKEKGAWNYTGTWFAVDKATSKSFKLDMNLKKTLGKDFDFDPMFRGLNKCVCYWDEAEQPDPTLIIVEFD